MKKIALVALCLCAVFSLGSFLTKDMVASESEEELSLVKKDVLLEERDGGEDEGIFLFTRLFG